MPGAKAAGRFLAVLTVRNEAAYLLEWLAHHQAVGFTDFLVFSNDCQDGTDSLLDSLADRGTLTHCRNEGPFDKGGIQFTALKMADRLPLVQDAEWILPLDIDEFVNIHVGDGTLPALLQALPEATAITLTWRLFGSGDQVRYAPTPVLDTFTQCAPVKLYWPWRSAMFKTLYRNDGTYRKLGVHRPRNPDPARIDNARWYDGEGRPLPSPFRTQRIFSNYGRSNYKLAQLNHYPLGSMENFVLKAFRGRAVHGDQMLDVDYWVERNFNTETDLSIQRMTAQSRPILQAYLADPDLKALHEAGVAWRQETFQALMRQEPYRALFARLLMTPPTRPVHPDMAGLLTRYAILGREMENAAP